MDYLFITDQPEVASFVEDNGVRRIFIDLESLGKKERQFGLDTYISGHSFENIAPVKAAVKKAKVLVRVNPLNPKSAEEVDACIRAGADILMLPMFRRAAELAEFCRFVRDRVPVVPLVETSGAADDISEIVKIPGVAEVYIGLNDLHLDRKQVFLFQPLADGTVDRMAEYCRRQNKPFGFGGIARAGEGLITPELILGEHVRVGSEWVILSRTFHRRANTLAELKAAVDMNVEIAKLNAIVEGHKHRASHDVIKDMEIFRSKIADIVAAKANATR